MKGIEPAQTVDWHDALSQLQQGILDDVVSIDDCAEVLEAIGMRVRTGFRGIRLGYLLANPAPADGASRQSRLGSPRNATAEPPTIPETQYGGCDLVDAGACERSDELALVRNSDGDILGHVYLVYSDTPVPAPIRARLLAVCAHAFAALAKRAESERSLRRMANYDALTGAVNRTLFRQRLDGAIASAVRDGHTLSVMFIDLDHFKAINDNHGHEVGDEVLRRFAKLVESTIAERHVLGRVGGDEFVLMIDASLKAEEFRVIARQLVEAVRGTYRVGADEVAVSASAGVSMFPRDGATAEKLLRAADDALLAAKSGGRGDFRMAGDRAPPASPWRARGLHCNDLDRIRDAASAAGIGSDRRAVMSDVAHASSPDFELDQGVVP